MDTSVMIYAMCHAIKKKNTQSYYLTSVLVCRESLASDMARQGAYLASIMLVDLGSSSTRLKNVEASEASRVIPPRDLSKQVFPIRRRVRPMRATRKLLRISASTSFRLSSQGFCFISSSHMRDGNHTSTAQGRCC